MFSHINFKFASPPHPHTPTPGNPQGGEAKQPGGMLPAQWVWVTAEEFPNYKGATNASGQRETLSVRAVFMLTYLKKTNKKQNRTKWTKWPIPLAQKMWRNRREPQNCLATKDRKFVWDEKLIWPQIKGMFCRPAFFFFTYNVNISHPSTWYLPLFLNCTAS